jgi:hypothetical protein
MSCVSLRSRGSLLACRQRWKGTPAQDEAFNQIAVAWRAPLSLEQILWELNRARDRVLNAISSMSNDELARVLADRLPLQTGHESEHAGFIRAWRERRGL